MNCETLLFRREFVTITGSVKAALMLSHAIAQEAGQGALEGWFFKTQAQWEGETGLTRHEQDRARRLLGDLLRVRKCGMPALVVYSVNIPVLEKRLQAVSQTRELARRGRMSPSGGVAE
jgi:hypothetical protein